MLIEKRLKYEVVKEQTNVRCYFHDCFMQEVYYPEIEGAIRIPYGFRCTECAVDG